VLILGSLALWVAPAGCGGDDEPETVTGPGRTATVTAPGRTTTVTAPETTPAPRPSAGDGSCGSAGLDDVRGLRPVSKRGPIGCDDAARVVRDYLDSCAGTDICTIDPGYECQTERFAGDRSDVECSREGSVVRFGFGS
jgi:hypothetical protein